MSGADAEHTRPALLITADATQNFDNFSNN